MNKFLLVFILVISATSSFAQGFKDVFVENYTNNSNDWYCGTDKNVGTEIKNESYFINTTEDGEGWDWSKKFVPYSHSNFKLQFSLSYQGGSGFYYGISFGKKNYKYYLIIGQDQTYTILKKVNNYLSTVKLWTQTHAIKKFINSTNELSVVRKGNQLIFYINNSYLHSLKDEHFIGDELGFRICKGQKIRVHQLKVGTEPLMFYDDFTNNIQQWPVVNNDNGVVDIKNGVYSFKGKEQVSVLEISKEVRMNSQLDFKIETAIRNVDGEGNYGLIFGGEKESRYLFVLSTSGLFMLVKTGGKIIENLKAWTKSNAIKTAQGATNKLSIEKSYSKLKFYINNIKVHSMNYSEFYGNNIGFRVGSKQEVEVKYLKIYSEAKGFYEIAREEARVGNFSEALKQFDSAISMEESSNFYLARAELYTKIGKYSEAISDLNEAIKKSEGIYLKMWALGERADNYCMMGKYDVALSDYDAALNLSPNHEAIKAQRTFALRLKNNDRSAIEELETRKKLALEVDFGEQKTSNRNKEPKKAMSKVYNQESKNSFSAMLPPILAISDISFSKNVLEAEDTAKLKITVKNTGPGDAQDVSVNLSGFINGLSFPVQTPLPSISANGGSQTVEIDVKADISLPTSEAVIKIEVVEPNFKVRIKGKQLKFPTLEYRSPNLILAKYAVVENASADPNNRIDINEMIDVKFAVQNVGQGDAKDVKINLHNNQKGVMLLGVEKEMQLLREDPAFETILSGKYETITYRYFVNSEFNDDELVFTIASNEKSGNFGFSEIKSFSINKQLEESGFIRTVAKIDNYDRKIVIEDIPDFVVDVDTDIPMSEIEKPYTYALVIGNEDYESKQQTIDKELNVPFALNDARIFSHYLHQTFGVPKENINLLSNATGNQISQAVDKISKLAKHSAGKAEIIFYYAGHGLPHFETKEPYLIPVDVSGANIEYGIRLNEIYSKLAEHQSTRVIVFLDACFSGGARNKPLLASRGIKVVPGKEFLRGNTLVFASSSGSQVSSAWEEKQHGLFTYFLLKKIKESKGNLSFKELNDYLREKVPLKAITINKPEQIPVVKPSLEVKDVWYNWNFK